MLVLNRSYKFSDIFPIFDDFNTNVITIANSYIPTNSEIIDEKIQFITDENLYNVLKNNYSERTLKYNYKQSINLFINKWLDAKTQMWSRTLPFIKNELGELQEAKKRGDIEIVQTSGTNISTPELTTTNDEANVNSPTSSKGVANAQIGTEDNISDKNRRVLFQSGTTTFTIANNVNRDTQDIYLNAIKIIKSELNLNIQWFVDQFKELFVVAMDFISSNSSSGPCFGWYNRGAEWLLYKDFKSIARNGQGASWGFNDVLGTITINNDRELSVFKDGIIVADVNWGDKYSQAEGAKDREDIDKNIGDIKKNSASATSNNKLINSIRTELTQAQENITTLEANVKDWVKTHTETDFTYNDNSKLWISKFNTPANPFKIWVFSGGSMWKAEFPKLEIETDYTQSPDVLDNRLSEPAYDYVYFQVQWPAIPIKISGVRVVNDASTPTDLQDYKIIVYEYQLVNFNKEGK